MNRRELETLLLTLESTPALLAKAIAVVTDSEARRRGSGGGFSLAEHVWHLADLEQEGYGARIRRLLAEDRPVLPDFDGKRTARERSYQERDLSEGIAAFAAARRENVRILRDLSRSAWERSGTQEAFGPITVKDIPGMMADHDRSHTQEVLGLLSELKGDPAVASDWTALPKVSFKASAAASPARQHLR